MPRPFFTKLILPSTLQLKKLRIPDNFLSKVKDELSVAVALTVPDGHVWRVGLRKTENKIWFQEGWQEFVERYYIRVGYFVIFRYEGSSAFNVSIFNLQNSEVNHFSNTAMFKRPYPFEELEDDNDNPPVTPVLVVEPKVHSSISWTGEHHIEAPADEKSPKPKKRGRKKLKPDASQQDASAPRKDEVDSHGRFYESASARKRTVTAEERERTLNAAKAFEPPNPFCRVVLRPSYLYRGCIMYLPACFAQKHLCGVSGFIKLQLPDGRQWSVRCRYGGGKAKLSQGWYEFTLENNLGEGDVCVLEMLNAKDLILKVTIFRVLESSEILRKPGDVFPMTNSV